MIIKYFIHQKNNMEVTFMKRLLCVLLIMVLSMTLYSSAAVEKKAQSYDIKYTYTEGIPDPYETQQENDNGFDFKSMVLLNTNGVSVIHYNHNIHVQKDVDILGFPVYETRDCEIKLYNIPEYCDYDLELYSANDTKKCIARSANGKNYDELIQMTLEPGFYFVKVYSYMGYSDQKYSIKITRPFY